MKTKKEAVEFIETMLGLQLAVEAIANSDEDVVACTGCRKHEIHIHRGIEKMALLLGVVLTYDPNWSEDRGEISCNYGNVRLFQLWDLKKGAKL